MFKKLALIGLTATLIGCGTSPRAIADTNVFTQAPPINYDKFFNETTVLLGSQSDFLGLNIIQRKALCCTCKQNTKILPTQRK